MVLPLPAGVPMRNVSSLPPQPRSSEFGKPRFETNVCHASAITFVRAGHATGGVSVQEGLLQLLGLLTHSNLSLPPQMSLSCTASPSR